MPRKICSVRGDTHSAGTLSSGSNWLAFGKNHSRMGLTVLTSFDKVGENSNEYPKSFTMPVALW